MNVEKTMEFILSNLASVSVKLEALAERQDCLERQQERTDRQMKGVQKLLTEGAKQLIKQGRETAELKAAMKELAAAQKRTEERFQRWLDRGATDTTEERDSFYPRFVFTTTGVPSNPNFSRNRLIK